MHQIPCKTKCALHFGTEGLVAYRNSKCGLKIYVYFDSENVVGLPAFGVILEFRLWNAEKWERTT